MQNVAYSITLEKIVGTMQYVYDNLYDERNFQPGLQVITLVVDLTDGIPGGEYKLTLMDENNVNYGTYICDVSDYTFVSSSSTNELLSTTIKISNL